MMVGQLSPGALPTPKPLDVVFTGSKAEWESFWSTVLQPFADSKALLASLSFSHASIVIDDNFALEAVPMSDGVASGEFSGAVLGSGVRLIHLLDLNVPAWRNNSDFVVLRSKRARAVSREAFSLQSKVILQMFESQYSLNGLMESAEVLLRAMPESLEKLLRKNFNWTAPAKDMGTRLATKG